MDNCEYLQFVTGMKIEKLIDIFGEEQINEIINFDKEIEDIEYHPGYGYLNPKGNPIIGTLKDGMFTYGPGIRLTYYTGNLRRGRFPETAIKYYVCKEEVE